MEPPVRAEHDDDRKNGEQDDGLFTLGSFEVLDEREIDVRDLRTAAPADPAPAPADDEAWP